MPSNLADSHTSTGAHRRVQCDRQNNLTFHTPLLLDRLLVRCIGVIDLLADMEPRRADIVGHGETTEMDRCQWLPGS